MSALAGVPSIVVFAWRGRWAAVIRCGDLGGSAEADDPASAILLAWNCWASLTEDVAAGRRWDA